MHMQVFAFLIIKNLHMQAVVLMPERSYSVLNFQYLSYQNLFHY